MRRDFARIAIVALGLGLASHAWGEDGPADAVRLATQMLDHTKRQEYAEAIPFAERLLAIREKALGPEHPDTASSLINLAFLRDSGDTAETGLVGGRAWSKVAVDAAA